MTIEQDIAAAFAYEPETGNITRRYSIRKDVPVGRDMCKPGRQGYLRVGFRGAYYAAHRMAWLLQTGHWPAGHIDHINLDKTDNRWSNLRIATPSQNNANWRARGSLPKGVTRLGPSRFQAQICVGGHRQYLGTHSTPEAAHEAYVAAATKAFGSFARAS